MNLSAIRPSFSALSSEERLELILQVRYRRRYNAEAKKQRATRAASKASAPKHEKQAIRLLDNISAEDAAKLLALLGDVNET